MGFGAVKGIPKADKGFDLDINELFRRRLAQRTEVVEATG